MITIILLSGQEAEMSKLIVAHTHTHTHIPKREGVTLCYLTIDTNPHILNGGLRKRRKISFLFHSFPPYCWFRILASLLFFFFNSPVSLFKPLCVSLSLFLSSLFGFIALYLSPILFLLFPFFPSLLPSFSQRLWICPVGVRYNEWKRDPYHTQSYTHTSGGNSWTCTETYTHTLLPLSLSFTHTTHTLKAYRVYIVSVSGVHQQIHWC